MNDPFRLESALRGYLRDAEFVPAEDLLKMVRDDPLRCAHALERVDAGDSDGVDARMDTLAAEIGDRAGDSAVLAALSRSKHSRLRCIAALSPLTGGDCLSVLAGDEAPLVRALVAAHAAVPAAVLLRLSGDDDVRVLCAVGGNVAAPGDVVADMVARDGGTHEAVAENRSAPLDVLRQLAASKVSTVRWNVAANPSTPPDVLAVLSDDADVVRAAVAANAGTSPGRARRSRR